ncbi:MAG TPA: 2-C-methyl-D-erythritol 2,4-cyclodiphosphate synthase [Burkholderiaceae bacterium]
MKRIRIGQGFDVHALVPGRRLVIGGVELAHPRGLLGHSDADVLLHAITDALLGAAAIGDIGRLFPDTDAGNKDADSRELLAAAARRVLDAGWRIGNIDCTVVAQQPRIASHVDAMRESIAGVLGIDADRIGIKGKTTEKLGFTGRGEGIAAFAVVLLTAEDDRAEDDSGGQKRG